MAATSSPAPSGPKIAAVVLLLVLGAVAVLLFLGIYLAIPQDQHFVALVVIGAVALIFALVSYLSQAISRDPSIQRSLAWGFFGMGFAVLILTVAAAPDPNPDVTTLSRIVGLIVILILLSAAVAGIFWRIRSLDEESSRVSKRQVWSSQTPPSAFTYGSGGYDSPTSAPASPSSPPAKDP